MTSETPRIGWKLPILVGYQDANLPRWCYNIGLWSDVNELNNLDIKILTDICVLLFVWGLAVGWQSCRLLATNITPLMVVCSGISTRVFKLWVGCQGCWAHLHLTTSLYTWYIYTRIRWVGSVYRYYGYIKHIFSYWYYPTCWGGIFKIYIRQGSHCSWIYNYLCNQCLSPLT
jgi:hypothetical protein